MADCNSFKSLRDLDLDVLDEVVREAELRLASQLQMATAADQRALSIVGFQVTVATAALGGGVALAISAESDLWLAVLAIAFSLAMAACAHRMVRTVRPQKFCAPGNRPLYWLPQRWMGGSQFGFDLRQARVEQAACLDEAIEDNKKSMDQAAARVRKAIDWTVSTVIIASIVLIATLIARNVHIHEPTSDIAVCDVKCQSALSR